MTSGFAGIDYLRLGFDISRTRRTGILSVQQQDRLDEQIHVLVLAAGLSTRLRDSVAGLPKPLVRLRGRPVLVRQLSWLYESGFRSVWMNLHYRPAQVRTVVLRESPRDMRVRFLFEPQLLGTAGTACELLRRTRNARRLLVVYGDNLTRFNLRSFIEFHEAERVGATVAIFDRRRHPHTGIAGGRVVLDERQRVLQFVEGDHKSELVNAGVYLLEKEVLSGFADTRPLDFGRHVFPSMLRAGKAIAGFVIDGYCLGIDTPDAMKRAEQILMQLEGAPA